MNELPPSAPLVLLLQLEQRSRQAAATEELLFVMVNETHQLIPYRQAVLWNETGAVVALSSVALPDPHAPFVLWLRPVYAWLTSVEAGLSAAPAFHAASLPDPLRQEWSEWLPLHGLLLPLRQGEQTLGWLLLTRDEPFRAEESALLALLLESYALAWRLFRRQRGWWTVSLPGRGKVVLLMLGLAMLAWPVSLSVLGPAELVAIHPEVVRAPMEGVIARFHVAPNEQVQPGQRLFDLDDTTLRGRLEMAEKNHAIAESEYQLTAQIALQDPRSKAQLTILAGRAEEKRIEVEALREQLGRTLVQAKQSGLAVFSDPQHWIGKPVTTGERILVVAEEQETEVEVWLSVGDLIPLTVGAPVTLFLNIDPLHPVHATMRTLAYEADMRPDRSMAHLVRATLTGQGPKPRLGLKGTARIEGAQVSLLWWILRRPIAMVRQWLGV